MGARTPAVARERARASALGRAGEREEIAAVLDFLVSDTATFTACATIDVNGGSRRRPSCRRAGLSLPERSAISGCRFTVG